jgi:hypothetical protein
LIGTRTITAIDPNVAISVDSPIDLTTVVGVAVIRNRTIDDVQETLDRICETVSQSDDYLINWSNAITGSTTDTPIVGQSLQYVNDASEYLAGDTFTVVSDDGVAVSGTIIAIDEILNTVTLDTSIDAFGTLTNPVLLNTSVTLKEELRRIKAALDSIDSQIQEALADGDCNNTAFLVSQKYLSLSTNLYLDGVRKRRGTAGTRAALTNGAGNAQILLTSLVLGLSGNDIDFQMIDPGAPSVALSVAVTGTYDAADRKIAVTLQTNGASVIISTAAQVVAAINAHVDAKRLVVARYGGTGAGVQAALAATPLAGGLNNGTGDYAELEQVLFNAITGTGYRWVSFHIRPLESNRMSSPPRESEELDITYSIGV